MDRVVLDRRDDERGFLNTVLKMIPDVLGKEHAVVGESHKLMSRYRR